MEKSKGAFVTESELYQQYLNETKQAPVQTAKPSDADLYQQYLAETKQQPPEQKTSVLEAGITGFGKGASFGYLPQLEAVTEPIIQGIVDKFLPKDPEGFNVQEAPSPNYTQRRDQQIKAQQLMAQEHPVANAVGEVGGSIASGIATGGGISKLAGAGTKALTLGGRLAQAAKTGAVIGAIRNPGDTEGEISPLQAEHRFYNAATDAATGVVLQGGLEGLGKVASGIKNASGNLATYAEEKALKAAGAMKGDFKKLFKSGKSSELGRAVLDEGILSPGDTIHDIASKAEDVKNSIGQNISEIYKKADSLQSSPSIDIEDIANNIKKDLSSKYQGKAGSTKILNEIQTTLDEIAPNGKVNLSQAQEIRQSIDDGIPWGGTKTDSTIAIEKKAIRNAINDSIKKAASEIDQVHGTDLSSSLLKENKRYSQMAKITDMAIGKSAGESANQSFGFGEKVAAGVGVAAKGGPGGVAAALGAKAARQYGNPIVALAANKASKVLSLDPGLLGSFASTLKEAASVSPEKFTATIEALIQKPEFKKALDSLPDRGFNLSPALGENNSSSVSRSPSTKFTRSNP
jgi:hypothetical protein